MHQPERSRATEVHTLCKTEDLATTLPLKLQGTAVKAEVIDVVLDDEANLSKFSFFDKFDKRIRFRANFDYNKIRKLVQTYCLDETD